jgi:phage gp29-like protein
VVLRPPKTKSKPTRRDMRRLSASLASLTPERLAAIMAKAEDGWLDEWSDLCDRMVEVDAGIRSAYETRTSAVAGARCYIEAGIPTGDPERDKFAEDARLFVERSVFAIPGLEVAVQESLDAIGKGVACHEIEWDTEGDAVLPVALHWVHQRRFRWHPDDWSLRLVDAGDGVYNSTGEELAPDGWIVHAPKTIAGYPTRTGVMRAVAWPYLFRRWATQFWVQGAENFAWPFMYAEVPRGATDDVRQTALDGLETMTQERKGLAEAGTSFKIIETTVKDGGTWKGLFETLGGEIQSAILGMTDMANPGRVGAYASVEVRRGTTVDARIAMDERALSTSWSSQLIAPLVRFNADRFDGLVPPIPRIRWSVSAQRQPIVPAYFPYVDDSEIRGSINLDPRVVQQTAAVLDGPQIASLQAILAGVSAGTLAPAAAKLVIGASFPNIDGVSASAMVDAQATSAPLEVPSV